MECVQLQFFHVHHPIFFVLADLCLDRIPSEDENQTKQILIAATYASLVENFWRQLIYYIIHPVMARLFLRAQKIKQALLCANTNIQKIDWEIQSHPTELR